MTEALVVSPVTSNRTNRSIQNSHSTYANQSQIDEALHLLKHSELITLNESTLKYLGQFRYTKGTGVTQAKVTEICKLREVPTSTYSKTVSPEVNSYFDEPIIITIKLPKIDKLGRKNPNGSTIKILQPLWKIKELIRKKQEEIMKQHAEFMAQFTPCDITGDITGDITPNAETLCESKDEQGFSEEQNNTIREIPLDINNKSIKENDPSKKYGIKKVIKKFLREDPFFNAFDDIKKHEIEKRVQLAFIRTKSDWHDIGFQKAVLEALRSFVVTYEKNPENLREQTLDSYYKTLYVCLENALWDYQIEIERDSMSSNEPEPEMDEITARKKAWNDKFGF